VLYIAIIRMMLRLFTPLLVSNFFGGTSLCSVPNCTLIENIGNFTLKIQGILVCYSMALFSKNAIIAKILNDCSDL